MTLPRMFLPYLPHQSCPSITIKYMILNQIDKSGKVKLVAQNESARAHLEKTPCSREKTAMASASNPARRTLGWKVENAAEAQRMPVPLGRDRWLTQEEAAQLLAAARQEPKAAHLPDFILLALHTGMRTGEILNLEWNRVDLHRGYILLGAGDQKNGLAGSVPLNQTARDVILSRARFRATHRPAAKRVFCDRRGKGINTIKKGFTAAVKRAGIAYCTPHDLRRTCGSWLVQTRTPIQEVARLLRHSDIQVTMSV